MNVSVNLPPELQQATQEMVQSAIETAVAQALKKNAYRPYMTQQEACKYLHVAQALLTDGLGITKFSRSD